MEKSSGINIKIITDVEHSDLISVIIPVFNGERFLPACLDSVCGQTYDNLEILIVDDGSTDGTLNICNIYAAQDHRIRILESPHSGPSTARNIGLAAALGAYIAFVDSDDTIEATYCENLLQAIVSTGADMVCCRHYTNDETTGELKYPESNSSYDFVADKQTFMKHVYLDGLNYVVAWAKLAKRNVFSGIHYPEGKIHEDEAVIHKLVWNCEKIASIQKAMYFYRTHDKSIMQNRSSQDICDELRFIQNHYEFFDLECEYELALEARKYFCHFVIARFSGLNKSDKAKLRTEFGESLKKIYKSSYFNAKVRLKYLLLGSMYLLRC